jgi:hypothetical protein
MAINARALAIVQQSDDQIQQTVRLFQGVTPIRDIQVAYSPGVDQATAAANLASAVKAKIARFAADTSTVACAPGTILDLSDPVVTPPPTPPVGFDAWQDGGAVLSTPQVPQHDRAECHDAARDGREGGSRCAVSADVRGVPVMAIAFVNKGSVATVDTGTSLTVNYSGAVAGNLLVTASPSRATRRRPLARSRRRRRGRTP